jgi:predicted TIM-barrel fold metal-dependent hydrolase
MPDTAAVTEVVDAHQHVHAAAPDGAIGSEEIDTDMRDRVRRMAAVGIDRCVLLPVPGDAGGMPNALHARANTALAACAQRWPQHVAGTCCTVNPADPAGASEELDRALGPLGMQAVAFHHRFLGMDVNDRRMDPLLERAREHGCTVFVHIISFSAFEAPIKLFSLARRYPDVRFAGLDGFSSNPQAELLRELAPDHPNVWLDTAVLTSVAHGLGEFIERVGPDRLLLGTNLYPGSPHFAVPFPLLELRAMGLPADTLDRVLRRNVLELLDRKPG